MTQAIIELIIGLIEHSYKCAKKPLSLSNVEFILGCVKAEYEHRAFMPKER